LARGTDDAFGPAAPGVATDLEAGVRPVTVCIRDERYRAGPAASAEPGDVTITNRTWSRMEFTLSDGSERGAYVLPPAESVTRRGLTGVRITFHDGRGKSSLILRAGHNYQFVELAGLFLLQSAW
jgi:hypothetical protein